MPRGADDRYWEGPRLPSVFKHTLLDRYVPQFAGMTGSRSDARRVVYLDGFAGRGRYDDGSPASPERILRIAQHQGTKGTVAWTCFFVEAEDDSAAELVEVVDEYVRQGVTATAHHGDVLDVLDIPYNRLVSLLRDKRRDRWPPTEILLNFSLEAVRRIGGLVGSEYGSEKSMRRLDEAVGGDWWRRHFALGVTDTAVETVVTRFGERLMADSGMDIVSVPVRRAPKHKPLYHLLFGTRRQHGLWAFGDSVAWATQAWWSTLDVQTTEEDPYPRLFPVTQVDRPSIETVEARAVPEVAGNLEDLLRERPSFRVVDHTHRVFGAFYGQVRERVVRDAIKLMHRDGRTSSDGKGPRIRNLVVVRPQAETARRSGISS
jgi:hypothetical protein